jgi:ABC-type sugar transport system permease subunit
MIVLADVSIYSIEQETLFQAKMDFKSFKKSARYVYLPKMKEVLFIIFSIGFLIGFRQHELAYELTSSGGGFTAETWSYWNYREMFEFANIANAAIEAIFILLVLLVPILTIRKKAQDFC